MLSVVVPVYNEKENLHPLLEEIQTVSHSVPISEIIFIDDASNDGTFEQLQDLTKKLPMIRVLRHSHRAGQSRALWSGIRAAKGPLIVTLDGDGQNNPADIPLLFKFYNEKAKGDTRLLIAGQRAKRHDNVVRRLSSRGANHIRAAVLKDGTKDTGCSLKLFAREDYMNLPYFNTMHRYLPALMKGHGVEIHHHDVSHRPRQKGISKYGFIDRFWIGIHDLFGVHWLLKRARSDIDVTEFFHARTDKNL